MVDPDDKEKEKGKWTPGAGKHPCSRCGTRGWTMRDPDSGLCMDCQQVVGYQVGLGRWS